MYIGHGTAFDGLGSWSFGNDSAMNVIIFGVDNSSTYTNNCKNNFLVLPEEKSLLTILMVVLRQQRKNLVLILVKQANKFAWVCITMVIIVIYVKIFSLVCSVFIIE